MRNILNRLLALVLVLASLPGAAPGQVQDQPGTSNFPPRVDSLDSLIRVTNSARTTLTGAHDATVTTLNVGSTATFPASGAGAVDSEIFFYTGKTATSFTGVTRGADGSTAASHLNNAAVRGVIAAAHHDVLSRALIATQTKLGAGASTPGGAGLCLVSTGAGTTAWTACPGGSGGGSASLEELEYYKFHNALLEPDAIEPIKRGLYSYVIGPNESRIGLSIWRSVADTPDTGWLEIRNPKNATVFRDITIRGVYDPGPTPLQGSHALFINPGAAVYSDPRTTYFERQRLLNGGLRTTNVGITYFGTNTTFATDTPALCGTYGCVVVQTTLYDAPYILGVSGGGQWINFDEETGDLPRTQLTTAPYTVTGNGVWRRGIRTNIPLNGYLMSAVRVGPGVAEGIGGPAPGGSVTYINLPPGWSKVPDTRVWLFRDDSWGVGPNNASVDLTKWAVQDSTPSAATSGASINQRFKWHEVTGNSVAYGADGMTSVQTFTRAPGLTADFDVSLTDDARCAVGFTSTAGSDVPNWAHAYVIDTSVGQFQASIYEDGNVRATTGAGSILSKRIQHFRITTNADGSATFRVQSQGYTDGSGNLAEPGSAFWHTYTVPGSLSATNSLKLFATCFNGTGYFRNLKVSAAPQ